jgi:hypothetical protein
VPLRRILLRTVLEPARTRLQARPVYQAIFGDAWDQLDERVQALFAWPGDARGCFVVRRDGGMAAGFLGRALGLPAVGTDVAVHVTVEAGDGCERWRRELGGTTLVTVQRALGRGLLAERFGVVELVLRVDVVGGGVRFRQVGAKLVTRTLRVRLPRLVAPRIDGEVSLSPETMRPHVEVSLRAPIAGLVLGYAGTVDAGPA